VIHGVRRDDSGSTLETVRRALNKADTSGAGISLQALNKVLLLLSLLQLPLSVLVFICCSIHYCAFLNAMFYQCAALLCHICQSQLLCTLLS
jgi:hypothetical protein